MNQRPLHATNLAALVAELTGRFGERPAVSDESGGYTFAQLADRARRWRSMLESADVRPGHHVGLLAGNSPEWLAAAFGIWSTGATLVPISTFATERELAEILEHADLTTLIVQKSFGKRHLLERVSRCAPPCLRRILPSDLDLPRTADEPAVVAIEPQQTACILYTSGTTGRPKGVLLSHRAILATIVPTAHRSGLVSDDSLLSSLPLFWVAGLVIRALPTLVAGCELRLMETFTAERTIAALHARPATAVHLRPPQIGQLLAASESSPGIFASIEKGNGRTEWFNGVLPESARFITGYGMTEMAGYVTSYDWHDERSYDTPIGIPLPGVELRIVKDAGETCATNETGEVWLRGPGMYSGYYKEPVELGRSPDGWFRTGDLGFLDERGRFHFSGRSKELLRVKGINVSPLEVETVLAQHPDVEAVYVVGLPVDGLDQQLVALIVTRSGADRQSELSAIAQRELSTFKRPTAYLAIDRRDVPLGGTSKPQRGALAVLAETLHGGKP